MEKIEKIKNYIKLLVTDKKLYIYGIITLAFFGIFCHMQFAPDTYSVLAKSAKEITLHFFSCGRFVTGIFIYIFKAKTNIGNDKLYYISYSLAMIFFILSLYKLDKIISKEIKNRYGTVITIAVMIILNVFSFEMFLYIEKGIMVLSVFLCILALEQVIRFFNGKKSGIIWGLLFMFIANCCYQGNVGIFLSIAIVFAMKYSDNIKKFIINNIVIGVVYAIPAGLNFLLIKLLYVNNRVKGDIVFNESLKKVIDGTERMIVNNYGLLPKRLFLSIIIIVSIYGLFKLVTSKYSIKKKAVIAFSYGYLTIGTLVVTVLPQFMQSTASIWFVVRSSYPMGCIIGTLLLNTYIYFYEDIKFSGKMFTIIVSIVLMLMQFISFNRFAVDNYIGNYVDREVSLKISDIVYAYETTTGNTVDKVAIYADSGIQYSYDKIKVSGDMNIKAYSIEWSTMSILKFYIGHDLKSAECDKEIEEYFKERNWTSFSQEQIIFKDNTMHICLY